MPRYSDSVAFDSGGGISCGVRASTGVCVTPRRPYEPPAASCGAICFSKRLSARFQPRARPQQKKIVRRSARITPIVTQVASESETRWIVSHER